MKAIMRTTITALLLVIAGGVFMPSAGQAQPPVYFTRESGPYFRLDVGAAIPQDGRLDQFGSFPAGNEVRYEVGFNSSFAGGFAFNRYLAAELEVGANGNKIDSVNGFAVSDTFLYHFPILANLVLQCPIPHTGLVPYVGAGVGGSSTLFDTERFSNGAVTLVGSDSDFVFAWHAFAGLRIQLNEQMFVGLDYKYFAADSSSYSYPSLDYSGPDLSVRFQGMRSHLASFSFTFRF
jgi:opacity protein-like surface antigen